MSKKILTYGSLQTTIRNVVSDATFPSGANLNKCVTTVAALAYGTSLNSSKLTMSSTHPNNCLVSAEDLTITAKTVTPPSTVDVTIPINWGPIMLEGDNPDMYVGVIPSNIEGTVDEFMVEGRNDVQTETYLSQTQYAVVQSNGEQSTIVFRFDWETINSLIENGDYLRITNIAGDWEGYIPTGSFVKNGNNITYNGPIVELLYMAPDAPIIDTSADLELCYTSATSRVFSGRGVNIEWFLEDPSGVPIASGFEPFDSANVEQWRLSRVSSTVCFMVRPIAGLLSYDECIDMGYGEPVLRITAHMVSTSTGAEVGQATVEATWNGFFWHVQI